MQYPQLRYLPESEDPSLTIETRELVAKVIDNTGLLAPQPQAESKSYFNSTHVFTPFVHHFGYHGIRTLYNKTEKRNAVIPFCSWLNLQGATLDGIDRDPIDERAAHGAGRGWPLVMEKKDRGAVLRLDPLPSMQMRYQIELQPAEPDGIDFSVRFELGRYPERGTPRLRVTWPCYINGYDDVRLFYPRSHGGDDWNWGSIGEKPDIILGETVNYRHRQEYFQTPDQALPLAFGHIGERVLILMFSDPAVRLYLVNAGGHLFCSPVQNPAWDFSWNVENYPLHKPIGFDGRLIYTRFESTKQVQDRYLAWLEERGAKK